MVIIGLLGFGTIGKGVYHLSKTISSIEIRKISVRNPQKHPDIQDLIHPTDVILADEEIKVIIDTTGDEDILHSLLCAFELGKHVITANKVIVAKHFELLHTKAENKGVQFLFEAAVGAGMPLVQILRRQRRIQHIEAITGILNGTCNYILSQMEQAIGFDQALLDAQSKGFAEPDPSLDISGMDSAYKLAILASIASGRSISIDEMQIVGINQIQANDVVNSVRQHKRIRLVASYNPLVSPSLIVEPRLVNSDDVLYHLKDEENILILQGSNTGTLIISGKGAGSYPTSNAILDDLLTLEELL
ncbi:MAG: homoserine dehydrogenase [Candidatus Heimdallarchaeota archaeon]|nr:homoserine dehydrogenase [Candidatus Heimdallarchaeota archaeon]